MADYAFDVFISYRRLTDMTDFVVKVLKPRLEAKLRTLGGRGALYLDEEDDSGAPVAGILQRLQASALLLGVWAPAYEQSAWTLAEWESMALRESAVKSAGWTGPPLVLPICLATRHLKPGVIKRGDLELQCRHNFCPWTSAYHWPDKYCHWQAFDEAIDQLAHDILDRLDKVPPFRPDFPLADVKAMKPAPIPFPGRS